MLKVGASFIPVVGGAVSLYDAYQDAKQGNWGNAALNAALGAASFIPGGVLLGAGKGVLKAAQATKAAKALSKSATAVKDAAKVAANSKAAKAVAEVAKKSPDVEALTKGVSAIKGAAKEAAEKVVTKIKNPAATFENVALEDATVLSKAGQKAQAAVERALKSGTEVSERAMNSANAARRAKGLPEIKKVSGSNLYTKTAGFIKNHPVAARQLGLGAARAYGDYRTQANTWY